MTALVTAVFLASVLGSLHCAGMCGAFLAFAVYTPGAPGAPAPRRTTLVALYNLGRLVTYTALGAAAGALGAAVDMGGSAVGLQRTAAALAGATIAVFGLAMLARTLGLRTVRLGAPPPLARLVQRGHAVAMRFGPRSRALTIGLLTTLLPCGWLYAFAVTAAGTASPLAGGVTMAVFWLGTLPVMVSLGLGVQRLAGALGRRLPAATAALLVIVGLTMVFSRTMTPPMAQSPLATTVSDVTSAEHIMSLPGSELPCCDPE